MHWRIGYIIVQEYNCCPIFLHPNYYISLLGIHYFKCEQKWQESSAITRLQKGFETKRKVNAGEMSSNIPVWWTNIEDIKDIWHPISYIWAEPYSRNVRDNILLVESKVTLAMKVMYDTSSELYGPQLKGTVFHKTSQNYHELFRFETIVDKISIVLNNCVTQSFSIYPKFYNHVVKSSMKYMKSREDLLLKQWGTTLIFLIYLNKNYRNIHIKALQYEHMYLN